jgi:hypothetical protein
LVKFLCALHSLQATKQLLAIENIKERAGLLAHTLPDIKDNHLKLRYILQRAVKGKPLLFR